MTNYTDDQLKLAILDASDQRSIFIRTAYSLEDIDSSEIRSLRTLLYYLPDQQDDWQECGFSDIRKGDRVRLEFADITHEAVVKTVRKDEIVIGGNSNFTLYRYKNPKIFRIPAPVTHPDPEVCEHIIVYETTRQKYGPQNREYPSFHYSWDDDLWRGDISRVLQSREILEWDYAKVVIKDD